MTDLRDGLIAADGDPSADYAARRAALLETPLTPFDRTRLLVGVALLGVLGIGLGAVAIGWKDDVPDVARQIAGAGSACMLAACFVWLAIRARGKYDHVLDELKLFLIGAFGAGGMIVALTLLSFQTSDEAMRQQLATVILTLLGLLGVSGVMTMLQLQHRQLKVRLLELELRLARIDERLAK